MWTIPYSARHMLDVIDRALAEDLGDGDLTTAAVVPEDARARARIEQKAPGVPAGLRVAEKVFERVDPELRWRANGARAAYWPRSRVGRPRSWPPSAWRSTS